MTKEELLKLLKENLQISVDKVTYFGSTKLQVTVMFDGEEVCSSFEYLPE